MSEVEGEGTTMALSEYDVLDRDAVEEKGWIIVHESVSQGHFRAEKMVPNGKVEQAGATMDALLLAISYAEGYQARLEPPPTPELIHAQEVGDRSRAAAEGEEVEGETAPLTVTATNAEGEVVQFTEAEWALRDSSYEPAQQAMEARQEANTDEENIAKQPADDEIPESESIVTISHDNQPEDTLLVREGEESLADVDERKQEESIESEGERGETNTGIGPHGPEEGPAPEGPMGGPPETYDPGPGLSETEQAQMDEHQETIDQIIEARDEETPPVATEEEQAAVEEEQAAISEAEDTAAAEADVGPVGPADSADAVAGLEPPATEESSEAPAGAEEAAEAPPATPAAEAKAEELGVDLSTVEGTGADGKIVVGDVEDAAAAAEPPPE